MFSNRNGPTHHSVDVSRERLSKIVSLARAHEADLLALDASDSYDDAGGGTLTPEEDPPAHALRVAIGALAAEEQAVLVALAWIGRGDFRPEEFDYALTQAFDRKGGPVADYLLDLPALGEILDKGASACGAEFGAPAPSTRRRPNGALH